MRVWNGTGVDCSIRCLKNVDNAPLSNDAFYEEYECIFRIDDIRHHYDVHDVHDVHDDGGAFVMFIYFHFQEL